MVGREEGGRELSLSSPYSQLPQLSQILKAECSDFIIPALILSLTRSCAYYNPYKRRALS